MNENRKIQYVAEGEQILFRSAHRWGHTFIQLIWVSVAGWMFHWSMPALIAFFERGEIIGAARHLERFDLSPRGLFAAVLAWCGVVAWWGLGGLYEILKVHMQQDRFLIRSESLVVKRRKIITRQLEFKSYEPVAFRLSSLDGSLEAKTKTATHTLTSEGTKEDRVWLLELLQQRYKSRADLVSVTETSQETIGNYIVERRPDGVTHIYYSRASTIGCAVIAAVISLGMIALTVWLFWRGSGAGVMTLMFAFGIGVAGVGALNKRSVEASLGRLRVQWSSPAAKVLRRILSKESLILKIQFADGSYEADSGTLKIRITPRKKSTPTYDIVLRRKFPGEENEKTEQEHFKEDTVLDIHGHGCEHAADYLLRVLADSTRFPVEKL